MFGIPAELGTFKVPRGVHAFQGVRKSDRRDFLMNYYALVSSGAIAAEGQSPWSVPGYRVGVTQAEMARRAGVARTTITRRISRLAALAKGYETPRQRRRKAVSLRRVALVQLEIHKNQCDRCASGLGCEDAQKVVQRANRQVRDEEHYHRPAPLPVLTRQRRFGMASRYGLAVGARREMWVIRDIETGHELKRFFQAGKASAACDRLIAAGIERGGHTSYSVEAVEIDRSLPSVAELAGAKESGAWWDGNFKADGFKAISMCWWDSRICDPETGRTVGTLARLVMSAYEEFGLLDEIRHKETGKAVSPAGWLEIHQRKVARYLGCTVKAVYAANCVWERLGVLRIAAGNPRKTANGLRRGPMIVKYLPLYILTPEEAAIEQERMARRVREIVAREGAQRLAQLMEGQRLHGELLAAWRGREHSLMAFWRECVRRMDAARIFPDLITQLIPPTRPAAPDRT